MKELIKRTWLGKGIVKIRNKWKAEKTFEHSEKYWIDRYDKGGNSGAGSYHRLAVFKAAVINAWVKENNIQTVIEFGCGDGNQLRYFHFPSYIGYDVSTQALKLCSKLFQQDVSKHFALMKEYDQRSVDMSMSLDVIYHLIEDDVYHQYMSALFQASHQFVVIYSSDKEEKPTNVSHVRQRQFSAWVKEYRPDFALVKHIPNQYPYDGNAVDTSISDFYIFQKK
ncbi:MAG TPA: methyltransferase domain-containing protein [Cytophagaceae bacterium]|jgi:hypothetical protein|nr:methyltransferase domain-containing protein [Cytophagaceae bacterium]